MILSNITVPLLGLVDTAVIGHLDHAYYLGASSVGAMVITSIIWLCGFLRMSTTGLAAQAFGSNDELATINVLARGIMVAFCIGLLFIVGQQLFLSLALQLAGGSEEVQYFARQYTDIRIWGLPAALANLVVLGWLLGTHQSRVVMWILISTNLINLLLDILFVLVFDWKIKGVASATLISEYSGLVIGLIVIWRKYQLFIAQHITVLLSSMINLGQLRIFFALNRDILIRTLCLEICFIFITFQGARLGDTVVAANAILLNFLLLLSFGLDGIANATEAQIGKAKGANNDESIAKVVMISVFWTVIFALSYTVLFALGGDYFIHLLTSIDEVSAYASNHIFWLVLLPLIACWCYLFDGVYIGLMKVNVMRNGMLISTFGCFFPLWYLLKSYGNHGLWAAFLGFMLIRGVTLIWHFKTHILKNNEQYH